MDDKLTERMISKGGDIVLTGEVTPQMARDLRDGLMAAEGRGEPLIVEITTLGGDAEMARKMVADIDPRGDGSRRGGWCSWAPQRSIRPASP